MIAECYDLTVQCDDPFGRHVDHQSPRAAFNGRNASVCHKEAREVGWLIKQPDSALCPDCAVEAKRFKWKAL